MTPCSLNPCFKTNKTDALSQHCYERSHNVRLQIIKLKKLGRKKEKMIFAVKDNSE